MSIRDDRQIMGGYSLGKRLRGWGVEPLAMAFTNGDAVAEKEVRTALAVLEARGAPAPLRRELRELIEWAGGDASPRPATKKQTALDATIATWRANLAQHHALIDADIARLTTTRDARARKSIERNLNELATLVRAYEDNLARMLDLRTQRR